MITLVRDLGPYLSYLLPILLGLYAWLNRQWFYKLFLSKMALVEQNLTLVDSVAHLQKEIERLNLSNEALLAQAEGWKGAAESSSYVRRENEDLRRRVSSLESERERDRQYWLQQDHKYAVALDHIGKLYAYIAKIHIKVADDVPPPPPDDLKADLR